MNVHKIRLLAAAAVVLFILLTLLLPSMLYVVDEREMAVVLQFGNPVAERTEPGLGFKKPFIQQVRRLPKTRQFWGDTPGSLVPDLPTKDDKKIEVIPWAIWKIKEPRAFVQVVRTMERAGGQVGQYVRGAIRDVVAQYDLAELVRSTDRELDILVTVGTELNQSRDVDLQADTRKVSIKIQHGRQKLLDKIKKQASSRLSAASVDHTGRSAIELVDVGISHIEFVESVRRTTFDRWIAERQAISALNTNEGERMKQEVLNKTAAEVQRIEGEGQRRANETRGNVDAEIIREYAKAIEETGEFYTFIRTLEAYKKALNQDTRLILTTDSEFLRLLKEVGTAESVEVSDYPASRGARPTTRTFPR